MANNKIKIAFLTSSSDIGGTEQMLLLFLKYIDREQFEPVVISLFGSGELTKGLQSISVKSYNFSITSPLKVNQLYNLYTILKTGKFDIIHTFGLRADTIGRVLGKLARIPIIISSIRSPDPWRKPLHTYLDRLTAPLVTLYISNSYAGKESRIHREKFPADKIVVIHNGVEAKNTYISADEIVSIKKELQLTETDYPIVVVVANIRKMKGHRDIIQSIPLIIKDFPNIKFLFVGRDDSNGEIKQLAEDNKVLENIRFLGYQKNTGKYYSIADIFLLPSHWEGCPASILEAMAYNLPVIATQVGGIPEIIEHHKTGILISPKQPLEIATSIIQIGKNEALRNSIKENARKALDGSLTVEKMTEKISDAYLTAYHRLTQK